jgi:hypothetical protein
MKQRIQVILIIGMLAAGIRLASVAPQIRQPSTGRYPDDEWARDSLLHCSH